MCAHFYDLLFLVCRAFTKSLQLEKTDQGQVKVVDVPYCDVSMSCMSDYFHDRTWLIS